MLGTAAEHVQVFKRCAHLLMICNVCYFSGLSPASCVHGRDTLFCCVCSSSVTLINNSGDPTECCRVFSPTFFLFLHITTLLAAVTGCCWLLVTTGCWLLAAGYYELLAGCWLLAAGYWLLVTSCWLLVTGCWLLVTLAAGCWLLAAGYWLAAGSWLLAAGCWLVTGYAALVTGCWLLVIYWLL